MSWPLGASRRCRFLRAACHAPPGACWRSRCLRVACHDPQGPPGNAATCGQPVIAPPGPAGEAAACGQSVMAPKGLLAMPLPAGGLSCPPGASRGLPATCRSPRCRSSAPPGAAPPFAAPPAAAPPAAPFYCFVLSLPPTGSNYFRFSLLLLPSVDIKCTPTGYPNL